MREEPCGGRTAPGRPPISPRASRLARPPSVSPAMPSFSAVSRNVAGCRRIHTCGSGGFANSATRRRSSEPSTAASIAVKPDLQAFYPSRRAAGLEPAAPRSRPRVSTTQTPGSPVAGAAPMRRHRGPRPGASVQRDPLVERGGDLVTPESKPLLRWRNAARAASWPEQTTLSVVDVRSSDETRSAFSLTRPTPICIGPPIILIKVAPVNVRPHDRSTARLGSRIRAQPGPDHRDLVIGQRQFRQISVVEDVLDECRADLGAVGGGCR